MTSTMKNEHVILVNEEGRKTGVAEKMKAHRKGLLHRAFSIFLFNARNETLLQQRALSKYHFAGLWSNACCSHPRPNEKVLTAAKRRLNEELHLQTKLKITSHILYHVFDPGSQLHEHEFDYILCGTIADQFIPFDPKEVAAIRWVSIPQLKKEIKKTPEAFTPWLLLTLKEIRQ